MRRRVAVAIIGWGVAAGVAQAGEPARVAVPAHIRAVASDARIGPVQPAADHRDRTDDQVGRLRSGIGGTLVNILPFDDSRFHLSAGGRLFGRPRANPALDERGLLAAPRGSGGGWRGGRRFAPALLMGIDEPAGGGVSLGLDAGVVMGPAMDRMRAPRTWRRGPDHGGMSGGPNGVARVTMGYRF